MKASRFLGLIIVLTLLITLSQTMVRDSDPGLAAGTAYTVNAYDVVGNESGQGQGVLGFGENAHAQGATINAASCEQADVQAAIDSADYGDTVMVPAGSCTWSSTLTITKGITLQGAGVGSTVITMTVGGYNGGIRVSPDATSVSSEHKFEINGFTFDGDSTETIAIYFGSVGQSGFAVAKIHDTTISDFGSPGMIVNGPWKGVVYNNTWTLDNDRHSYRYLGDNAPQWNWLDEYTYGTENVIFFEDNDISIDAIAASSGGWATRVVIRYNNYNTQASMWPLIDFHGNQGSGVCGTMGAEVYGNSITGNGYSSRIDIRGGRVMHFKNTMTDGGYSPRVRNESCNDRVGTCARDADTQTFNVQDSYHFLNYDDGSIKSTSFSSDGCDEELSENSEYWNQNTLFNPGIDTNLTTGVGVGTKTQMELVTTCTEGVGFWATDQGEWNSENAGADGQLYKCTSTNTWELYYTPYTYPHPLRGESLVLRATPADQAIHLTWTVDVTLPVTSTWQLAYDGPAGDQPSPISDIPNPTRAYTLTGLTNYTWYTVTLNALSGSTPFLTDTVRVMPTDIFVYLPLVLSDN